ncbi:type II secretion system GspH family protein [bacterium]|nr:type II secretion system GspH family protein [bacterium]
MSGILKKIHFCRNDSGFTMIEIIVAMIITGIVAGIFAETMTSSVKIYNEHNLRQTKHIDFRRTFDMIITDIREWESPISVTASQLLFDKYMRRYPDGWFSRQRFWNRHVGYVINADDIAHRREDDDWGTQYPLISGGLVTSGTSFSTVTEGGVFRVVVNIEFTINGKPMRMHTVIFPRNQGG